MTSATHARIAECADRVDALARRFDSRVNKRKPGSGVSAEWKMASNFREKGHSPEEAYKIVEKNFDASKAKKVKKFMEEQQSDS